MSKHHRRQPRRGKSLSRHRPRSKGRSSSQRPALNMCGYRVIGPGRGIGSGCEVPGYSPRDPMPFGCLDAGFIAGAGTCGSPDTGDKWVPCARGASECERQRKTSKIFIRSGIGQSSLTILPKFHSEEATRLEFQRLPQTQEIVRKRSAPFLGTPHPVNFSFVQSGNA
jgi:hypothetical protein